MDHPVKRATARSETALRSTVRARHFEIVMDQPPQFGGEDLGPTPTEVLLMAWAGCMSGMAHIAARQMGFAIRSLEIEVEGPINFARGAGKPSDDRAGFLEAAMAITVDTDADDETLREWQGQLEARCPVGDNLANPTPTRIAVLRPS
jgi:uncharacterized OsmC-like protein